VWPSNYKPRPLKFKLRITDAKVFAIVESQGDHVSSLSVVLRVGNNGRHICPCVHVSTENPVRIRGRYIIFNGDAGSDEAPPAYIRSVQDFTGACLDFDNPPTYRMEKDIGATIGRIGAEVLAREDVLSVLLRPVFETLHREADSYLKGRHAIMQAVASLVSAYGNDIPRLRNRIRSVMNEKYTLEDAVNCVTELETVLNRVKQAKAVI